MLWKVFNDADSPFCAIVFPFRAMLFPLRAMSENLLKTLPNGADPVASDSAPPDEDDEFCILFSKSK